ncbi:GNAT family N-acetyltransferase [Gracilibacillus marinus]|uniref:GNAT family N-acetyltransferase n=1 Tax=Gracilibacillus marinus TaxID=630535 RepID=A0ABV8VRA4_9BACI
MIRQLTEADNEKCQALIQTKPAENLFIIGDIEAYGYEQDFQKVWGQFNEQNELIAILLKYERNYIPFAIGELDAEGFANIINQDDEFAMLSGLITYTEPIEAFLHKTQISKRQLYYVKLTNHHMLQVTPSVNVHLLNPEEINRLKILLQTIPEFRDKPFNLEIKKRNMQNGVARCYYVEEDGVMVSTASTSAENKNSAMIVAVGTNSAYKRKGYATACLSKLCQDLLAEGKELCLFYENEDAGKIYKRLGFQQIEHWMMYTYE